MFDTITSVLLVSVVSVLWIILYVLPRRRMTLLTSNIPGPPGLPLIGSSLMLTGNQNDIFKKGIAMYETYGDVYKVWAGPKLYVAISNPEDAQCIFHDPTIVNRDYATSKSMAYFFGNGLLSNRDSIWRLHRKIVSQSFQYKNLQSYFKIFQYKANILVRKLEEVADGRVTDIWAKIQPFALTAICETVIGIELDMESKGMNDLGEALHKASKILTTRIIKPWLLIDWIYNMTSEAHVSQHLLQTIKEFSNEVIASKLEAYRNRKDNTNEESEPDKKIESFLDCVIGASDESGQILTPSEIQDEVSTIIATGSDTVTTSLAFTLVLLGLHPEHQDRMDKELADVFGDSDREATMMDIKKMKYLEYCIKESLRLFPIATLLPREINKDVHISKGRVLPAGSTAMVVTWPMHRSAKNFVDPNSFLPDRWAPENSVGRHPCAYLPFAAGPRMCVGYKYAMLIMQTVLIALLRRYRVGCSSHTMEELEQNIEIGVSISSMVGYKIQFYHK